MQSIYKSLRQISFRLYTEKGNSPRTFESIYKLTSQDVLAEDLKEFIDRNIDDGYFYLDRLSCGRYIKSYRINEITDRTIEALKNKVDSRVLKLISGNRKILYLEFCRWLNTKHNNMMSSIVDEFWHQFITFSYEYRSWCLDNYDRFIHHIPTPQYEKNIFNSENIIQDTALYFKRYLNHYEISDGVLLYSLPLRLYIHEGLTKDQVKKTVRMLANECNIDEDIENNEVKVKNYDKSAIDDDLKRNGFSVIDGLSHAEFCKLMESYGEIITASDIKINELSNRKFNDYKELDLHTDTPLAGLVAWYCVVQDNKAGESLFVDGKEILNEMSEEELCILNNTRIKYPVFKKTETRDHPIVDENQAIYYTSWLKYTNYSAEQVNALQCFESYIEHAAIISVRLRPGQALILDNKRMLHGRGEISQNSKRYLYRLHVKVR